LLIRIILSCLLLVALPGGSPTATSRAPANMAFEVDPGWPKPLPEKWILGHVTGVAVDAQSRVWVLNRPASITDDELVTGAIAAPPLVIFNQKGDVVGSWNGGVRGDQWPHREHSIAIDPRNGSVWISGNGDDDGFIVKYTADGRFALRIGSSGPGKGSNDTSQLGRASGLAIDAERSEIYVADGYSNRRVIVFDTEKGAYKRHWGAHGRPPVDGPVADRKSQLMQPHGIALSADGIIYVGDRPNNRIQSFTRDGRWLADIVQRAETGGGTGGKSGSVGSIWDAALWPLDPRLMLIVDGSNSEVRLTDRQGGKILSTFGRTGPYAGEFRWPHAIAIDGSGQVYVGEVSTGKRVQRFRMARQGD
jgi:DNA-binding beta-propeller fold protein YncE